MDIIDYYCLYKDIDIELRRLSKKVLSVSDAKIFSVLVGEHYSHSSHVIFENRILNTKRFIGDREITKLEVIFVLDKLDALSVPITEKTFSVGIRKFILNEEKEKEKIKKQ